MSATDQLTTPRPKTTGNAFPDAEVKAALEDELLRAARDEAEIREIDLPAEPAAQRAMSMPIDSLVVVRLLVAVEPIIGFELKNQVVREGGYASVDDAITHLLPRISHAWEKQKGKGK